MYIIFDGRHIKNKFSGLGRFTFSLIFELIKKDKFEKLDIILDSNEDYQDSEILEKILTISTQKTKIVYLDAPLFSFIKGSSISKYVNKNMPDIYFHPHFDLPLGIKVKSLFVVHDVFSKKNFYHEFEEKNFKDLLYAVKKKRFVKNIIFNTIIKYNLNKKHISCIAVSSATKEDLLDFIPRKSADKIKVVYEAAFADSVLEDTTNGEINLKNKKYLLYVGDRRPHKNLKKMIDIFDYIYKHIDNTLYFYLVGSQEKIYFDYREYLDILQNPNIIVMDYVSDSALNSLYKNASAFFFLSKHEGFGLPLLEAAKYNIKIITSDRSSLCEIAPPGSLLLSPYSPNEKAAQELVKYISNSKKNNYDSYLNSFSWSKAINEIFYEGSK